MDEKNDTTRGTDDARGRDGTRDNGTRDTKKRGRRRDGRAHEPEMKDWQDPREAAPVLGSDHRDMPPPLTPFDEATFQQQVDEYQRKAAHGDVSGGGVLGPGVREKLLQDDFGSDPRSASGTGDDAGGDTGDDAGGARDARTPRARRAPPGDPVYRTRGLGAAGGDVASGPVKKRKRPRGQHRPRP